MSAQHDIKVLLADVDGTLVTQEKVLTPDAIAAVRELRDAGVTLALTSGRPPRGMAMLVEPLRLEGAIAGFNGGVFVNPDMSVIESRRIDPDVARRTVELIAGQGLDVWLYTDDQWLIHKQDAPHVAREAWTVKFDPVVVPEYTDAHYAHAVKIVGVSDDKALVERCEKAAQDELGEHASAARSQPYYLDVTNHEANKGAVVAFLARTLGIAPKQVATIGDMPNDVLMFRAGGFSIAMGNSSDQVKRAASATTDSNEQEGFARAIRGLILGQPS